MARRAIGSPARRARAGDNLALAPEPAGAQVFAGRPNDRAFSLVGTWTCRTATGQVSTQTYARTSGQELDMSNDLTVAGHRYRLDETYRFDPGAGRWENVQAGGAYRGSAAPWTGSSWTFHGVENEGRPSDVQMTYTALGDSAFRRVFARDQGGAWVPYLSETCHRG